MNTLFAGGIIVLSLLAAPEHLAAQDKADGNAEKKPNACITCHGDAEIMTDDMKRWLVTEKHLSSDIHWKKGLLCVDCHGGDPTALELRSAHAEEADFRRIETPADIPGFCGHCHSNASYMSRYRPSPKTDQEANYWTSGHGLRLKEKADDKVANCVSCHSHHGIRAIDDLESPVYPTRVAETCATCHSDAQLMAGRTYHDRPIGHDQLEQWNKSVHAHAMKEKGDLSAPTCNDCHSNHGALPTNSESVSFACGNCHVRVAKLFAETRMKHRFEDVDLPGCATCHGNHEIHSPSDQMLGMRSGGVCAPCHKDGKYGATLAGADVARQMRTSLEDLKKRIADATAKLDEAEFLGMEVRGPRFELLEAKQALSNARVLVHSFSIERMSEALDKGQAITTQTDEKAEQALQEYTDRRIWLGLSMVPILIVVGLLLLYIRTLPVSNDGVSSDEAATPAGLS